MPAKGSGLLKYSDKKFFIVKAKAVGSIVGSKRLFLFRLWNNDSCHERSGPPRPLRLKETLSPLRETGD
jgi:hypothetical protein